MKKLMILFGLLFYTYNVSASVYSEQDYFGLPTCNDPKMIEMVFNRIKEYQSTEKVENIVEKRHQILILKDVTSFHEEFASGFNSKNNFFVANKLIMLKINQGLTDNQIRVCQSSSQGLASQLYLIIYPENYEVRVDIMNYLPQDSDFGFIYK